jgi:hypothetical protein
MSKKTVYICASFKHLDATRDVAKELEASGVAAVFSRPGDPNGIDGCLERIDQADLIYVNNPDGVIGKSVSLDLGYAIARGKDVYSCVQIDDPPISHLLHRPVSPALLVKKIDSDG